MKHQAKLILLLVSIFILLMVALCCVLFILDAWDKHEDVPDVVQTFFDKFIDIDYSTEDGMSLFKETFYALRDFNLADATVENLSAEQNTWELYFHGADGDAVSYELVSLGKGFLKVVRYDVNGDMINPPIGVWYTLRGEYIDTWRIGLLEPFSRYSEESSLYEKGD